MTTPDAPPASTDPPGPRDSPGFLLWRVTLRWQRTLTTALRPLELTHVQFVLLAAVWWLSSRAEPPSRPPTQRQIADHAEVDVMMTSQVLRVLDERGLVRRSPDPTDGRIRRVTVTDSGRRIAERAVAVVESTDAAFFSRVHDSRQLLDLLHQLDGDGAT